MTELSDRRGRPPEAPDLFVQLEHDLLTPLAAIRALAEILRDYPELSREDQLVFLERILGEQARLERRIEAWLALRR
jgi:signal transduction histidine kinase